jgi:hypothetical protein
LTGSASPREQLYPFAETDNHSDDSAALTSNDPNPTEASTPVTILRGTEIWNPFPSRRESANFQFLDGAAARHETLLSQ